MYKTVFKACFRYLTSFDDLVGFTGVNRQIKENWLKYFEGTKEDILMVYLKMD